MSSGSNSGNIALASVLDDFVDTYKNLPGFRGADIGRRNENGAQSESFCIRGHFRQQAKGSGIRRIHDIPKSFAASRVSIEEASYFAIPRTACDDVTSNLVASGAPCAHESGGGHITMPVVDRKSGKVGFLSSWAAAAGPTAKIGSFVFNRPHPLADELPIGSLSAALLDEFCSAALCDIADGTPWLPVLRPSNQVITSLNMPRLGDRVRVGNQVGQIDGIGVYFVEHPTEDGGAKSLPIRGFRIVTKGSVPSGALIYDDVAGSATGMAIASDCGRGAQRTTIASCLPRVFGKLGLRLAGFDDLIGSDFFTKPASKSSQPSLVTDPRELTQASAGAPRERDVIADNHRLDIATVLWPSLKKGLEANGIRNIHITDRVEKLDATGGAHRMLVAVINRTDGLKNLGITNIGVGQIKSAVTMDQICECLNDVFDARF